MSIRMRRMKTLTTRSPMWLIEYRHRSAGRTRLWMRLPALSMVSIIKERAIGPLPLHPEGAKEINTANPAPPLHFVEALRFLFEARHSRWDKTQPAPPSILFRMRHRLTEEVIGEYRVVGECTCANLVCEVGRRQRRTERLAHEDSCIQGHESLGDWSRDW